MGHSDPVQILFRSEQRPVFWEPAPARHISQHLSQLLAHLDLESKLDEASDLTDVEEARNTRESVAKVENIGVGHLDQLTGLGVREVEAAEETGRPVVEASDSNSYPQCAGLAQPAFFPRDNSSSYHVTTGR